VAYLCILAISLRFVYPPAVYSLTAHALGSYFPTVQPWPAPDYSPMSPPTPPPDPLAATAWEARYQDGHTRWDLGQPAPGFAAWLGGDQAPPPGRAVVLGAGRGHDALLFARHGFAVTAVDFAPSAMAATAAAADAANLSVTCIERNIFDLVPTWAGQFDYVIEHTCFCALDPNLRKAYRDLVVALLKPQGSLLAVFFTHSRPGGPPFGSTAVELRQLFSPSFHIQRLEPNAHAIASRRGEEHVAHFCRR